MKLWKCFCVVFVSVLLAVSVLPAAALAAESEDFTDYSSSSAEIAGGTCGENASWSLDENGVLTISGSEEMDDYTSSTYSSVPWYTYYTEIEKIVVSDGITHVGAYVFVNTRAKSVSLPDSLISVGAGAFYGCSYLQTIDIPDQVTDIGMASFANCTSVTEISIGQNVLEIGSYAFQNTGITSLTIPASVTSIGTEFCYACSKLTKYTVENKNAYFSSENGVLFNKDKTQLICYPVGNTANNYTVPDSVTQIEECAFYQNTYLNNISLTENMTEIGDWAFAECTALKTISIPDSVTIIGYGITDSCTALQSAVIGSGIEELSYRIFYGCTSLVSVTLKAGLTSIDSWAFYGCTGLSELTLPDGLESIGVNAFYNCTSLTALVLPEGLTYIGSVAFNSCTSLSSINIPDSVTYIGVEAFYNCTNLTVEYPSHLTLMEDGSYQLIETVSLTGTCNYEYAYEVLDLVNEERAAEGLSALTMDEELLAAAMQRAAEINIYFSHTRPSGLNYYSVSSKAVGENIAAGQSTPASAMTSWMNSSDHKANILGSNYQSVGIGCFTQGGIVFWVQIFGTDEADAVSQPANCSATVSVALDPDIFSDNLNLYVPQNSLLVGSSTTVIPRILNPGWTYVYALLDAESLTWTSSDTSAATVNASGTITAKGEGSVVITAKTTAGSLSASSDITITGKSDTLLVRRGNWFYVNYTLKGGDADMSFTYGKDTDEVLIGDWDGDGIDTICVRRGNRFYFSNTLGGQSDFYIDFGRTSDEVVVGDWDGDGCDTICVRRGNHYYINNTLESGNAAVDFTFGRVADEVLAGDWDGDGYDTLCIRRGNTYYINNTLEGGNAAIDFTFGRTTDSVLSGDWDGDGYDTLCIRRGNHYYINNTLEGGNAAIDFTFGRTGDEVYSGTWK